MFVIKVYELLNGRDLKLSFQDLWKGIIKFHIEVLKNLLQKYTFVINVGFMFEARVIENNEHV